VTGSGGGIYQEGSTPNVDGDDGVVDNRGQGFTWAITGGGNQSLGFDFTPNASGELPKFAGGVLFGSVSAEAGLTLYQRILVYDANGIEMTGGLWRLEVPKLSSGVPEISVYRFAGIYYDEGISRIVFPDSGNVDHLTYGYAIPEPATDTMLLTGIGIALSRRRRKS
ncbi:MAG: PEP-CTERM sorting domain-containing protein, partial [Verrucomicrobiaceae bacterium]